MNAPRLVAILAGLAASALAVAWLVKAPPQVAPRRLVGRVVDEGGLPVARRPVLLFDHAGAWLEASDDCAFSLLACDSIEAGREVLRQLDAGTLAFPVPVASTTTDGEGRFSFETTRPDEFVVASDGVEGAVALVPEGGPLQVQFGPQDELRMRRDDWAAPGVPLTLVNPFLRQVARGESGVDGVVRVQLPALGRTWAMAEPEKETSSVLVPSCPTRSLSVGPPRSVEVQLDYDGGPVLEAELTLTCNVPGERHARTDGGMARFDGVVGGLFCQVRGVARDFASKNTAFRLSEPRVRIAMEPRARLRLSLSAVDRRPVGPVSVAVYPEPAVRTLFDTTRYADAEFDGGVQPLLENLPLRAVELVVSAKGFGPARRVLTLRRGLNEVAVQLVPAFMARGDVVDAAGRPVPGAVVDAWRGDKEEWLAQAVSDEAGRYALELPNEAPVTVTASHPAQGAAAATATPFTTLRLTLRAATLVAIAATRRDGRPVTTSLRISREPEARQSLDDFARTGTLRAAPASLVEDEKWLESRPDDAGVARFANLKPGVHEVVISEPGWATEVRQVHVPDAGEVTVSSTLEPGAVLMGTLMLEGQPAAGVRVELGDRRVVSNRDGRFRFEDLRPGPQLLVVTGDDETRRLEVQASAPNLSWRVDLPP